MLQFHFADAALFGLSAFVASYLALATLRKLPWARPKASPSTELYGDPLIFLIRDDTLLDANFSGQRLLQVHGTDSLEMSALRQALHAQFDQVDTLLAASRSTPTKTAVSRDGSKQAIAEFAQGTLRLKISSRDVETPSSEDIHRLSAQEAELETLRQSTDSAPYLVWRQAADGTPIWVNRAYVEAVREIYGAKRALEWPLPRLFPVAERGAPRRIALGAPDQESARWFECHSVPIGKDTLVTAFDADATVNAETQLREFMQTLTKTFSQLTIGLAIFDRSRNLALFNPALTELTRLPVDFLASRPGLSELLDKLRERNMAPEPKDYRSWRKSIADLEAAAENGSYSDTWSLPGNLTYRVTGRPHPDGAIAFLFEDISAEMTLTRQFRRELEVGQTLLNNMDDATALFSGTGACVLTNRAYRQLWRVDPDSSIAETSFIDASRVWHVNSVPTPIWGDFRDFAADTSERVEWTAVTAMQDGRRLSCRFIPMTGGGTQVIFRTSGRAQGVNEPFLEVV
ncbi:MAG: diguanylate cyclase [Boseongicola sp.]|nr:MAG: diguanylate cyclase [Boseongicola sp.]